ncbi:MAG TPA: hypothetical protein PKI11_08970 [Candidatus Hydrogenedentes bacterium]|nr:hypothetical protein [Candidatus Hydrogenedentota bacterium]
MKTVYIVTMWSGGRPSKKWKTEQEPEVLPSGTGVRFTSVDTKLTVQLIGSVSVEQYESGKEEMEAAFWENVQREPLPETPKSTPFW